MAKPMKNLDLYYLMIQCLIINRIAIDLESLTSNRAALVLVFEARFTALRYQYFSYCHLLCFQIQRKAGKRRADREKLQVGFLSIQILIINTVLLRFLFS